MQLSSCCFLLIRQCQVTLKLWCAFSPAKYDLFCPTCTFSLSVPIPFKYFIILSPDFRIWGSSSTPFSASPVLLAGDAESVVSSKAFTSSVQFLFRLFVAVEASSSDLFEVQLLCQILLLKTSLWQSCREGGRSRERVRAILAEVTLQGFYPH